MPCMACFSDRQDVTMTSVTRVVVCYKSGKRPTAVMTGCAKRTAVSVLLMEGEVPSAALRAGIRAGRWLCGRSCHD